MAVKKKTKRTVKKKVITMAKKKKQGIIYMPQAFKRLSPVLADRFPIFFGEVAKRFNLSRRYADRIGKIPEETKIVLIFAGAHGKQLLLDSVNIPKKIKVGFYLGGMHSFVKHSVDLLPAMERADFILCGNYEKFKALWLEHIVEKCIYFPSFFVPHKRYTGIPIRNKRVMKCLLAGAAAPKIYPLRRLMRLAILQKPGFLRKHMVIMKHPRWEKTHQALNEWELPPALNEDYAKTLGRYYCAIATASKFNYAIGKYFEIPAAGCLLLGEKTADLEKAGFVAGTHYVEINGQNYASVIHDVLKKKPKYERIRKAGTRYVRENHSIENRLKEFREILKKHKIK